MKTSEYPVWLAVPQEERDAARKAAGLLPNGQSAIEWNKEDKLWFARPGCDIDRVQEWLPDRSIRAGGGDPESEFLDVLTQAGLVVKGMPVMNGQRQRVSTTDDKNGKKSGVYSGYLDRRPGGWFINYHRADNAQDVTKWVATGGEADPVARLHIRAAAKQSQEDAARDRAALHAERTLAAGKLYARLPAADPSHPYLVRKGITPTPEIRQTRNGALVVPFFDAQGIFKTLQYIPEAGEKLLFKDAPKQGNFLVVGGPLLPGQPIQYAEGYATARSLNLASGRPVVMTIDAGNMVAVAQTLNKTFPDSQHLFMADFDHAKDVNKGLLMASEAAELVGGKVLYPAFTEAEIAKGLTDFNDLHQSRGLDAVRDQTAHLFVQPEEVPTVQEQQSHQSPFESDLPITPTESGAGMVLKAVREPGFGPELMGMAKRDFVRLVSEAVSGMTINGQGSVVEVPLTWTGNLKTEAFVTSDGIVEKAGDRNPDFFSVKAEDHNGQFVWVADCASEEQAKELSYRLQLIDAYGHRDEHDIAAKLALISKPDASLPNEHVETSQFRAPQDLLAEQIQNLEARESDILKNLKAYHDAYDVDGATVYRMESGLDDLRETLKALREEIATPTDTQKLASVEAGKPQDGNQENQNANGVAATEAASVPAPESSAIGPQPLNFTHNGQPASLNLEDHRPGQLPDATVIRPIVSVAPPMPSFTFNGQPASLTPVQAPAPVDQPAVTALREEPPLDAVSRVAEFSEPAPAFASVQLSSETASIASDGVEKSSAPDPAVAAEIVPPAEPASLAQDSSAEASVLVEQSRIEAPGVSPAALANEAIEQAEVAPSVGPQVLDSATSETDVPAKEAQDLSALLPRRFRSQTGAEPSAEVATDAINVGARIGVDEPPQQPSLIDKDALLIRVTHEMQNDNSVLYKLDNEPAFVDRGSRLEMVPGAGQSDEKIMAALLTAAGCFRGQIELTGSDAFKAKAIELIAQHKVNVSMKNPAQQLMLNEAKKALVVTAEKPDAVMGVTPPPYDPVAAPQAATTQPSPRQPDVPGEPVVSAVAATPVTDSLPEHLFAPDPLNDSAHGAYMPLETRGAVSPVTTKDNPPSSPDEPGSIDPSVHQSAKAAENGVTGKVIDFGPAPFKFDPKNQESVYIKLRTKTGTQTFWGKELAGVLRKTRIEKGRMVTLQWKGQNDVVIKAPVRDPETGAVIRYEDKNARRNEWSLSLLNGPVVRSGDDQGVKLAAYDAARFAMIQNSVLVQLNVPIEAPSLPRDGLFWTTPNGQGSAKAGDELTAPRPAVDSQEAGKLVMSSWSHDGQLDMALYRGDGPYLQGVVRHGDAYQHVLVSLPGHAEAPPMVFNMITEQGLVPIGVGNGINRSNGEAVSRENVAFRLEGDTATRIAKLDFPAEVPPALHHRLGFDERWKDTNTLPKSAPAAAPVAQPGALRPS